MTREDATLAVDESPHAPAGATPPRLEHAAIADLAFGSFSRAQLSQIGSGTHLALLPTDALELDLDDPAQRQFGDYELIELIGEGGMGVVYRARQVSLDREVAVKLLAAGPWASREFIARFLSEAQHAARMQHPNIVTVYEVGTAEELHYFSMRLVRGASLALALQREGSFDPRRAAALMRTVAEAVAYAHSLGVLHLDLKPANVLLDESGVPHVADFGLARRLDRMLAIDNTEVSGTPSYMAPEQAEPATYPLSPATDIWGLGAILYELVTGRPPFRGDNAQATLKLLREGQLLRPRSLQPGLSLDFEAIVMKCLDRDPAHRYASARELAEDLARLCEHRSVRARPLNGLQRTGRWARREPKLAATAMLAVAALLIGLVATTQQWRRAESNAATSNERLWESRRDAALRLQSDGKGFEALPGLIANIDEQEHAGKTAPTGIERREVGAILHQGVTLIDRMILPDANPLAAELSPDGSLLAVALSDQTVRWYDSKTLSERGRVDLSGLPTSDDTIREPRLLRFVDNQRLRVTLDWMDYLVNPVDDDSYLIDLRDSKVVEPPAEFADLTNAQYSADGRYAFLHNRRGELQTWQVEPWRPVSPLVATGDSGGRRPLAWMLGRGARFAATMSNLMVELDIYDPRRLTAPKRVDLPADTIVLAWAESGNGSTLALGDARGRVFLVDLATQNVRQLPTPIGREVTWLAFSEDDAWLAAVCVDGAAFAFDVASGDPLNSGQMHHEFELRHVSLSHRDRVLVASGTAENGPGQTIIWRLPQQGQAGVAAERLLSAPNSDSGSGYYFVGTSLSSGLLATATLDGEVRLWRLPVSPMLPARAPRQIPGMLHFDGKHIVDVEYSKLRIVSTNGLAATPWIELPQPPGFAELLDGGRTLVATLGTELRVFDAATLRLRYPPVALPNTPQRLVASTDGATAVLTFGGNGVNGFEEQLQAYDLKTGQRRPGEVVVKGPLRQLELSADASRLLATGPPDGATDVFDATTLQRIGSYPHNPASPVLWASFAADAGQMWLTTNGLEDNPGTDEPRLVSWDFSANRVRERRTLNSVYPIGVTVVSDQPFVTGRERDLLDPGTPGERSVERLAKDRPIAALAVSHDGHLIAQAFAREVQLYDAATAAAVGPPLPSATNWTDIIEQIAFAPDDAQLLAHTAQGSWLLWPIGADSRPLIDIHQDAALLSAALGGRHALQLPVTSERNTLRQHDPGAWSAPEPRPLPASIREIAGAPVPARDPGASALLLDLTQAYTLAPESILSFTNHVMSFMGGSALGVVRFDGTDYDIRGLIELMQHGGHGGMSDFQPAIATGIRVPKIPIAAFHVLLFAPQGVPQPDEVAYASVRLHYQNGSSALLPIRVQREVPGWSDQDRPTPFALAILDGHRLSGDKKQTMISDPRLPNPHPERLITTIDLEASAETWAAPAIFAVTAEPVIPFGDSGSKTKEGEAKAAVSPRRTPVPTKGDYR